eukprot:732852-Prorocentrum_lima.AAC.1
MRANAPEYKPPTAIDREALIQRIQNSERAPEPTVNQVLNQNMTDANRLTAHLPGMKRTPGAAIPDKKTERFKP